MFLSYVLKPLLVAGTYWVRASSAGSAGATGAAAPNLLHILSIIAHPVQ